MLKLKELVKVKVEQLENKNQFVIYYNNKDENILCFQSYKSLIAIYYTSNKKLYLNYSYFDFSKTTSKHLKLFINRFTIYNYETKQELLKLINSNENIIFFEE